MEPSNSFREFWPRYVFEHRHPLTRGLHLTGTLLGWALLAAAVLLWNGWLVLVSLVVPYVMAWFSHFFFEQNRPATFTHPLWSWLADQKMVGLMLAGKMGEEIRRTTGKG